MEDIGLVTPITVDNKLSHSVKTTKPVDSFKVKLKTHFIVLHLHDMSLLFSRDIYRYIDGLVQERRNSIANALELRLSCTNPSILCSSILLLWRHNEHDNVSNHQPHDCLLNRLFRRRSKKPPKPRVTGLCAGNSPETGEFPAQMASNAENVSIWWRHHVNPEHRLTLHDLSKSSWWNQQIPMQTVMTFVMLVVTIDAGSLLLAHKTSCYAVKSRASSKPRECM